MKIRIVRSGTPRHADEGLRIGTVRRPPRGVPKADFARRHKAEMNPPERRNDLALLAAPSHRNPLSAGCYCEDENRCRRSLLRALLIETGPTWCGRRKEGHA